MAPGARPRFRLFATERVEPLAAVLARIGPVLVFGALVSVLACLARVGWTDGPATLQLIGKSLALSLALLFSIVACALRGTFARLAQMPSPERQTRRLLRRICPSYARLGGMAKLWITDDAVHVVSPCVHNVYPLASLAGIEARSPRTLLEKLSPVPLTFNLVLRRHDGREVPLFVLAPMGIARSIREAASANTDRLPSSCVYRQGESLRPPSSTAPRGQRATTARTVAGAS